MTPFQRIRLVPIAVTLALSAAADSLARASMTPEQAEQVVANAMSRAAGIGGQAEALIQLAWPAQDGDAAVSSRARQEIAGFGQHGIPALRGAVSRVRLDQRAGVVSALLEAFRLVSAGIPSEYLPGIEAGVWYGDREARKLAIPELARFRATGYVLTIIDAAVEDPELIPMAVRALAQIRDPRARFWLAGLLNEGDVAARNEAAVALARIGGSGLEPLKDALRSSNRDLRLSAIRALLPVAGLDEITALHEYTTAHADDDVQVIKAVRDTAQMLEEALAAKQASESASPPLE